MMLSEWKCMCVRMMVSKWCSGSDGSGYCQTLIGQLANDRVRARGRPCVTTGKQTWSQQYLTDTAKSACYCLTV